MSNNTKQVNKTNNRINVSNIKVLLSKLQNDLSKNNHTQTLDNIVTKITEILNKFITNGSLTQNNKDNLNILTALLSRELKKAQKQNENRDKQILGILKGIIDEMKTMKNDSIRLKTLGEIVSTLRGLPMQPREQSVL